MSKPQRSAISAAATNWSLTMSMSARSIAFGTWFASRVALLADTNLPLSPLPDDAASAPCATCVDKPCLSACLGNALTQGDLSLPHCIDFRTRPESPCAHRCPAREACPIAPEHRYDADQIRYHYGVSLKMLTR